MSPLPKEEREEVSSAQKMEDSAVNHLPTDMKQHKHDLSHGSTVSPRGCLPMPQLLLAAHLPLKLMERFLQANTQNILSPWLSVPLLLGQQGDKLKYRMTSLVRMVKPGLKPGQDSQENTPSSMPEVKYHPATRNKCLATRSDNVGPISSRQGKKAVVAWKWHKFVLSTHTRQLRFTYHDDVPVVDNCQLKQRDCTSGEKNTDDLSNRTYFSDS